MNAEQEVAWRMLLRPAFGLKRWLAVLIAGIVLIGAGFVMLLHDFLSAPQWSAFVGVLTLRFLPPWARVVLPVDVGRTAGCLGLDTLLPYPRRRGVARSARR